MKLSLKPLKFGFVVALALAGPLAEASALVGCKVNKIVDEGVFEESLRLGSDVEFALEETGPVLNIGGSRYANERGGSVAVTGKLAGGKNFRNSTIVANTFSAGEIQSTVVINLRSQTGLISEISNGKSKRVAEFVCGNKPKSKKNISKPTTLSCEFKNDKGKMSSATIRLEDGEVADTNESLAALGDRVSGNLYVEECGPTGCQVTLTYNDTNDEVGQTSFVISKVGQAINDDSVEGLSVTCTAK